MESFAVHHRGAILVSPHSVRTEFVTLLIAAIPTGRRLSHVSQDILGLCQPIPTVPYHLFLSDRS